MSETYAGETPTVPVATSISVSGSCSTRPTRSKSSRTCARRTRIGAVGSAPAGDTAANLHSQVGNRAKDGGAGQCLLERRERRGPEQRTRRRSRRHRALRQPCRGRRACGRASRRPRARRAPRWTRTTSPPTSSTSRAARPDPLSVQRIGSRHPRASERAMLPAPTRPICMRRTVTAGARGPARGGAPSWRVLRAARASGALRPEPLRQLELDHRGRRG